MTKGSLLHKNAPPQTSADPIVAKLKGAGAIPVFHTTTPEFYFNWATSIRAWGTSRNPWNLKYQALNKMKIAYLGGRGIVEPANHVKKAMKEAIKVLEARGATVDILDFDFKLKRPVTETLSDIALAGAMGGTLAEAYADKTGQMTHYGKHFIDKAASGKYGAIQLHHGQQDVQYFYQRLNDEVIAKGYEVFLAPTMSTSHVPADYDFTQDEALTEDGTTFPKAAGMQYTLPWNFLNWCPVLNVPAGLSDQNMPIGMQVIGKPYDLETVLRVGKAFSKGGLKLYVEDKFPQIKY